MSTAGTEITESDLDWRAEPELELTPILSAALDSFYEHGYHGASVRDLARRVGVTVPALYYHHENKEAILFALLDASIERLMRSCKIAYRAAAGSAEDEFFNLIECASRFMARSGKIAYLDGDMRSLSAGLRAVYSGKRGEIETMLVTSLKRGVKAGLFDVTAPRDTARALLGMIQAIATWYRPDGDLSVDEVALRYVDIAAHTVGATPDIIARVRHPKRRRSRSTARL
jgi:TetR/AcrR family transcriptional regulator, cholesterol catabolism regulator